MGRWGRGWHLPDPKSAPRSLVHIVGCSSRGRGNCGKLRATSNRASKPVIRSFPSAVRTVEKQLRALASSPPELLVFPRFGGWGTMERKRTLDQRAYLNRMLRLALPFFRRRNIPRENASSNARYPGLAGYAIHAAPARSIWISRSLLTVTHFLGRTAAKSWVSPKTGAPAPPPPRPPSLPSPPPAGY